MNMSEPQSHESALQRVVSRPVNQSESLISRLIDIMSLFQTIAISSLLTLNFPSLYRSYTLNFAWTLGLFAASPIQQSIKRMRHLAGGGLSNASDSGTISFVNRKLSPYNSASYVSPKSLRASLPSLTKVDLVDISRVTDDVRLAFERDLVRA